ncbi:MAG: PAS domain S-box protein [Candidatus Obscuribacterales bacterium]|nr:PAS domain S-box protein [Candidatus Obscuribacterales bacterium]
MRPRIRLNLSLATKGSFIVLAPLAVEMVFVIVLGFFLNQAEMEVQRQIRSKAIIAQANTLSKMFYDAGVAMGGYSITKSPLFSDRYTKIVAQIPKDLDELKTLVGDNARQQVILQNLQKITETGLQLLNEAKHAIDDSQVDVAQFRARHMYKEIRQLADKLQTELHGLTEDEEKIANQNPDISNWHQHLVKVWLVIGVIVNVLLAVGLSLFFNRDITRRLNIMTDNSLRLARGDPLHRLVGGSDELSALDGTFHDMAEALDEATRKERAIIENAADVICSIDVDGKFVAVSPSSYTTWGYLPDELMGRRFIELILPDDQAETIRAVRTVRAEKGKIEFENRTKRKDGTIVTALWSTYWSEAERSMFCVAHDITERKLAEEATKASESRIRTIIENMLVGLIIITKDGIIESINPASERMFGYQSAEIVGQHVMKLFHDSTLFSVNDRIDRQNFLDGLWQRSFKRIGEFDALKKLGDTFPIEISLSELETTEGTRILANVLDVSERREVERLKKEFVSTVSHELRTPLTSIRGSLTLLSVGALGSLPEQAKKVVAIAERNTIRLITLINDILDIEKLESGKLDMVFDTISMATVLERSSESVKAFAEQADVRLEIVPSNAQVYADGDRLVQVLVNLCSNAVKFSPKGAAVTIQVNEIPNWIEVQVIDRGRGIPAKFKNLLFQRFQQVEASDAKKKGGTGLGLAICKGIIEAHGGQIGVESEEGQGSVFWFRIPPIQRAPNPMGGQSATPALPPPQVTQGPLPTQPQQSQLQQQLSQQAFAENNRTVVTQPLKLPPNPAHMPVPMPVSQPVQPPAQQMQMPQQQQQQQQYGQPQQTAPPNQYFQQPPQQTTNNNYGNPQSAQTQPYAPSSQQPGSSQQTTPPAPTGYPGWQQPQQSMPSAAQQYPPPQPTADAPYQYGLPPNVSNVPPVPKNQPIPPDRSKEAPAP